MKKQKIQFKLVATGSFAFVCSIPFTEYKINASKTNIDEWLLAKKKTIISCNTYGKYSAL